MNATGGICSFRKFLFYLKPLALVWGTQISVSGQNHNPFFDVSDINIGGDDYVLVPPDSDSNSIQTTVEMKYRGDIPTDGSTVLSEAGNTDVSIYEGGSLLTPMPHTWSDDDQENKDLGLGATHSADLGTQKELYARYDPPGGGTSSPSQYKYFTMLKLDLISPGGGDNNDPVNNPIDGGDGAASSITDGANEFTFSSASPGVLTIQFKAGATGISDLNSIVGDVSFSIDNVGQAPTWASGNSGGQASVSTDGLYLVATATFTGLPSKNTDFGSKTVKLLHDGDVVEEKTIEVFFPKSATNHPNTNSGVDPNWFVYWKDGGVCGIPSDAIYDQQPGVYGYVRPGLDRKLRLGDLAAETNSGPETYTSSTIKPGTAPPVTYGSLTVTGVGEGILCAAETVEHELYHLTIYDDRAGKVDTDGDGVADTSEPSFTNVNSSVSDPDTYNMGGGYSSYGDNEVRCRKKELNLSFTIYPEKDWANPGCQSKNQFGPHP